MTRPMRPATPRARHLTTIQIDARRTAIAKTLWRINLRRHRPQDHPPFMTLGLAVQLAITENA